jgi:hypothetical protein
MCCQFSVILCIITVTCKWQGHAQSLCQNRMIALSAMYKMSMELCHSYVQVFRTLKSFYACALPSQMTFNDYSRSLFYFMILTDFQVAMSIYSILIAYPGCQLWSVCLVRILNGASNVKMQPNWYLSMLSFVLFAKDVFMFVCICKQFLFFLSCILSVYGYLWLLCSWWITYGVAYLLLLFCLEL